MTKKIQTIMKEHSKTKKKIQETMDKVQKTIENRRKSKDGITK